MFGKSSKNFTPAAAEGQKKFKLFSRRSRRRLTPLVTDWLTGTSPIRLPPIGDSPMAKVQEYIGKSTVAFRQLSQNNINIEYMIAQSSDNVLAKIHCTFAIGECPIGEVRKPLTDYDRYRMNFILH